MRASAARLAARLLASACLCLSGAALAQDTLPPPPDPVETDAPPGEQPATDAADRRIYTPEDFARFAPKNALDMLEEVPGFSIQGESQGRGLGQASGNLLINGERLSSKSVSARDRLSRIPADNVVRIEIVDGATLDIPGLSGQVANVIATSIGGVSGQFEWEPQLPAANSTLRILAGNVSLSGAAGALDYTVSLRNDPFHGGSKGPNMVTFGSGRVEERFSATRSVDNSPEIGTTLRRAFESGAIANFNASYEWDDFWSEENEYVVAPAGLPSAIERIRSNRDGHDYEIGGDVEFEFGFGRLKVIGLESYRQSDFATQSVLDPDTGAPATGTRFTLESESGERIGRAEYKWQMLGGDWQLSGEAAFNRLEQVAGLFVLESDGDFARIPFPAGTGGVTEDRYEAILSFGRPITSTLSFQLGAGGEISTIAQTGANALSRTFKRPKGSLSLAWAPEPRFDLSLRLAREVGQLDFGDFLAQVNISDDIQNAANSDLRPDQSWEFDLEATRNLGPWGSVTLHLFDNRISDFITIVPLVGGGEGVGNIDSARVYGVSVEGTIRLDPVGLAGAKVDLNGQFRKYELDDPLTGERRAFDFSQPRSVEIDFRHDVPGSDWAWGAYLRDSAFNPYYRIGEFGYDYNIPTNLRLFVEHKDVFGLTVQARLNNILKQDTVLLREVYAGPRNTAPLLFSENRRRELGRIVNFTVSGSF